MSKTKWPSDEDKVPDPEPEIFRKEAAALHQLAIGLGREAKLWRLERGLSLAAGAECVGELPTVLEQFEDGSGDARVLLAILVAYGVHDIEEGTALGQISWARFRSRVQEVERQERDQVLRAYALGAIARHSAMLALGTTDLAVLLDELAEANLMPPKGERISSKSKTLSAMVTAAGAAMKGGELRRAVGKLEKK
ncbi:MULTISPECIES: hypothetical protein [Ramlibacter]|uniref:XRE family transcriptional regulator n=1 Tax=Ramlibacter aquaticus TaxID=2780094 RepID=A0ABR9SJY7_9BURK|nr:MULTISPECIES: hypothetical protein [Ramlibacter]MBE7942671.1 hypothetical protein [Ramlibacter aquaticus]